MHTHTLDMTTGSPVRLLLRFSLPLFIGNLLQQIYNLSDTAIAGHLLGDAALSQIGATAALYSLITTLAFGLNSGFALSVSRYFGADDSVRMAQSVRWMTILSTLCAAVITIFFLLVRFALADAMQIPADIRDGALTYLTVILAGIPLTMAYNLESSLMQAVGNSVTPLLFLMFSSFLNIALDLLFMGRLSLGVGGAAAATVLSQGISAVLGLFHILRREPNLRLGKRVSRAPRGFVSDMLLTGLSMALMSAIYSVGSVILQGSINALGNVYIAAQVGGRRLTELFHMPGIALGASVATYASQNFGANRRRRIVQGQWVALAVYGVWWLFALAFTFTAAPTAIRFITGSTNPDGIGLLTISRSPVTAPMTYDHLFHLLGRFVEMPVHRQKTSDLKEYRSRSSPSPRWCKGLPSCLRSISPLRLPPRSWARTPLPAYRTVLCWAPPDCWMGWPSVFRQSLAQISAFMPPATCPAPSGKPAAHRSNTASIGRFPAFI